MSNFLQPYGLLPTRLLCPWDSVGKNTGLLQGMFLTQGSNPTLPAPALQADSLPPKHLCISSHSCFPGELLSVLHVTLPIQGICGNSYFKNCYWSVVDLQCVLVSRRTAKWIIFCCCSVAQSWLTLCNPMDCSTPGFPVLHRLLEFTHTYVHWVGDAIQPSHLCLSLLLPSIFPSIKVISNELALGTKCPKYWSFSISPSNEYSGLISFRMDWFDLPAVQGTLKSLLQYHSAEASILRRSAFFIVQLSHPYMTNEKTIALTIWSFVGKVMSLLFNMLSSLVITFLPRSKHLLISWLQSPSAVILKPPKILYDRFQ